MRLAFVPWTLTACIIFAFPPHSACGDPGLPRRPVAAVLHFEDRTGDARHPPWRSLVHVLLSERLREEKAIRSLPHRAGISALRRAGISPGSPLEPGRARGLGEVLEAQRIVWGSYTRDGDLWRVTARVLHVASGKTSGELVARGTEWFALCDELAPKVLKEMDIEIASRERPRDLKRWTASPVALEALANAYFSSEEKEPFPVQEAHVRRAIEADPRCAKGRGILAALLGTQGKMEEAEAEAREALRIEPGLAFAHWVLGIALNAQDKLDEAKRELVDARRLDPDDPEPLVRLAEVHIRLGEFGDALACLEEAACLDPSDPNIHARLGRLHALREDRASALRALGEAERQYTREEAATAQLLFVAYAALGEAHLALKYHDDFAAFARASGANPRAVEVLADQAARLQAKLIPLPVVAESPREYTPAQLDANLRQVLTEEEIPVARNALASSPAIASWATALTSGAKDDLQKARALFGAMLHRGEGRGAARLRTALEVFAAWGDAEERFVCQDHARLYVAAAREVGLDAFLAAVEQDADGNLVSHACAAVFIQGKPFLADVSYRWFGVPHKAFQILDDAQAIGLFLCQVRGDEKDPLPPRIAVKLWPSSFTRFSLALSLMDEGRRAEGQEATEKALQFHPDHWMGDLCRGLLKYHAGDREEALLILRMAAKKNTRDPSVHWLLGQILFEKGQLEEALAEFRECLLRAPGTKIAQKARRAVAWILELMARSPQESGSVDEAQRALDSLKNLPDR